MSNAPTAPARFARLVEIEAKFDREFASAGFGATLDIRGRAEDRRRALRAETARILDGFTIEDLAAFGEFRKAHRAQ